MTWTADKCATVVWVVTSICVEFSDKQILYSGTTATNFYALRGVLRHKADSRLVSRKIRFVLCNTMFTVFAPPRPTPRMFQMIDSTLLCLILSSSILILSSHWRLCVPSDLFPLMFSCQTFKKSERLDYARYTLRERFVPSVRNWIWIFR
jgi:hypothetical protein